MVSHVYSRASSIVRFAHLSFFEIQEQVLPMLEMNANRDHVYGAKISENLAMR